MKVSRMSIANVIAARTLDQGISKSLASEVAAYLLENHRVSDLNSLVRDIQTIWAEAGYVEVIASSAHSVPDSAKKQITTQAKLIYPNAKEIVINEVRDPNVLGGVRINLVNQQLDLSVETKLNKFKQLTITGKD